MRHIHQTVVAAAVLYAGSGVSAVATSTIYNWTGFYVGGVAGYTWTNTDVSVGTNSPAVFGPLFAAGSVPTQHSYHADGFAGGLGGGFNWQPSNAWVFGFEADFSWSGASGNQSVNTNVGGAFAPYSVNLSTRLDWLGTARARVGAVLTNNLFAYGTGGFAFGKVNHSYSGVFVGIGQSVSGSTSDTKGGWTIGGGAEAALARDWTAKIEYLYYDLGTSTATAPLVIGGVTTAANLLPAFRTTGNILRMGVNYRFGAK